MSGFVSVHGSSRGAGIVARSLPGGWVWARRALPGDSGWSPAPACLFVPFDSFALASIFARSVSALGWRVWVRPGFVGSPVWAACGLQVPRFAVKVALPAGLSCSAARSALPPVPVLSSLGGSRCLVCLVLWRWLVRGIFPRPVPPWWFGVLVGWRICLGSALGQACKPYQGGN